MLNGIFKDTAWVTTPRSFPIWWGNMWPSDVVFKGLDHQSNDLLWSNLTAVEKREETVWRNSLECFRCAVAFWRAIVFDVISFYVYIYYLYIWYINNIYIYLRWKPTWARTNTQRWRVSCLTKILHCFKTKTQGTSTFVQTKLRCIFVAAEKSHPVMPRLTPDPNSFHHNAGCVWNSSNPGKSSQPLMACHGHVLHEGGAVPLEESRELLKRKSLFHLLSLLLSNFEWFEWLLSGAQIVVTGILFGTFSCQVSCMSLGAQVIHLGSLVHGPCSNGVVPLFALLQLPMWGYHSLHAIGQSTCLMFLPCNGVWTTLQWRLLSKTLH